MGMYGDLTYSDNRPEFIGLPIEDYKQLNKELYDSYTKAKNTYDELEILERNLPVLPNDTDNAIKREQIRKTKELLKATIEGGEWEYAIPKVQDAIKQFKMNVGLQGAMARVKEYEDYSKTLDEVSRTKHGWSDEAIAAAKKRALSEYKGMQYIDPTTNEPLKDASGNIISEEQDTEGRGMWYGKFSGKVLGEQVDETKILNDLITGFAADTYGGVWEGAGRDKEGGFMVKQGNTTKTVSPNDIAIYAKSAIATNPKIQAYLDDLAYVGSLNHTLRKAEYQDTINSYMLYQVDAEKARLAADKSLTPAQREVKLDEYVNGTITKETLSDGTINKVRLNDGLNQRLYSEFNQVEDVDKAGNKIIRPIDFNRQDDKIEWNEKLNDYRKKLLILNAANKYGYTDYQYVKELDVNQYDLAKYKNNLERTGEDLARATGTPVQIIANNIMTDLSTKSANLKGEIAGLKSQIANTTDVNIKKDLEQKLGVAEAQYTDYKNVYSQSSDKVIESSSILKTAINNNLIKSGMLTKFVDDNINEFIRADKQGRVTSPTGSLLAIAYKQAVTDKNKNRMLEVGQRIINYINDHKQVGGTLYNNFINLRNDSYDKLRNTTSAAESEGIYDWFQLTTNPLAYGVSRAINNARNPQKEVLAAEANLAALDPEANQKYVNIIIGDKDDKANTALNREESTLLNLMSSGTFNVLGTTGDIPIRTYIQDEIDGNEDKTNGVKGLYTMVMSDGKASYVKLATTPELSGGKYNLAFGVTSLGKRYDSYKLQYKGSPVYRLKDDGRYEEAIYNVLPSEEASSNYAVMRVAKTQLNDLYNIYKDGKFEVNMLDTPQKINALRALGNAYYQDTYNIINQKTLENVLSTGKSSRIIMAGKSVRLEKQTDVDGRIGVQAYFSDKGVEKPLFKDGQLPNNINDLVFTVTLHTFPFIMEQTNE